MSLQGIILINICGLALIALIVNLVRTQKLYTGYALVWLASVIVLMVLVSNQALLAVVTSAVGAVFPASTLSLLAFVFIFLVLISISVQISLLSRRQVELVQALALRELLAQEEQQGKASRKEQPLVPGPGPV